MRKIQVPGRIDKGVLTLNSHNFIKLCKLLDTGNCVVTVEVQVEPKTIDEYRAQYFAMRDLVASETGNTKADIHAQAKKRLDIETIKTFDMRQWVEYIKEFKSWAFEHFNVYL